MSYSFVNRPAVRNDITAVVEYYGMISPVLAKQFLFRLREAKTYIARSPFSFQIKYRSIRTLLLKQFPYHIHYLIDEPNKQIIILAVIHAYRNPRDYSRRQI